MRRAALLFLIVLWSWPALAATTLTTTYGQTLTWTGDKTIGTYADGSYYIVSATSVSFTGRTPLDVDGIAPHLNGCWVDPDPLPFSSFTTVYNGGQNILYNAHGWDSRIAAAYYDATLNICDSLPFSVGPGHSITLAYSNGSAYPCTGHTYPTYDGCLKVVEVVTVVASAPAAGTFRPPFAGTDKTLALNTSSIRYDVFQDVDTTTATTGVPALASLQALAQYPQTTYAYNATTWVQFIGTDAALYESYGRANWYGVGDLVLCLHGNFTNAEKLPCAIHMIQTGIDMYGLRNAGMYWLGGGGFCYPAKTFIFYAAVLTNSTTLLSVVPKAASPNVFCEDSHIVTIEASDVALTRAVDCGDNSAGSGPGNKCKPFVSGDIGRVDYQANPEWNFSGRNTWTRHFFTPDSTLCGPNGTPTITCLNTWASYKWMGHTMLIPALGIKWLGTTAMAQWGNDKFFDALFDDRNAWEDNRYLAFARAVSPCTSTAFTTTDMRKSTCYFFDHSYTLTPIDGSVTGATAVTPTVTISSPTNNSETGSATVTVSGTAASAAGIASVDVNGSAATGTTSWSRSGVTLADHAINTITATATGTDGGIGTATANVLRVTAPATCAFDFTLNGSWPSLPTTVFTDQGTGQSLQWATDAAIPSGVNNRHFSFCPTSVLNLSDDQYSQITIAFTPTANRFAYATVQAQGTSSSTYDNCNCTTEVGITKLNQIVDAVRTEVASVATSWGPGDQLRASKSGTSMTCLRNDVIILGPIASACTLSGGQPGTGAWGDSQVRISSFTSGDVTGGDITAPMVSFVTPTSAIEYVWPLYTAFVTSISGTATDGVGVSACTYENTATGVTGSTTGTTSWSVDAIALIVGDNRIRVMCSDAAGNIGQGELTILVEEQQIPLARRRLLFR